MKKQFHALLIPIIFLSTLCYSQNKEIALIFNANVGTIERQAIDLGWGGEMGVQLKYPLEQKTDWETGLSFRYIQVGYYAPDYAEHLFHVKIPLQLTYRITPQHWRAHLGVWGSYLIAGDLGTRYQFYVQEEKEAFNTFFFGANTGFSYRWKNKIEFIIDYGYSINSLFKKENLFGRDLDKIGLHLLTFGVHVPIKI